MNWTKQLRHWLVPSPAAAPKKLAAGMYHFQHARDGRYIRFHMRVEPDGQALLVAAAAEAVRLPPLAARVVHQILARTPIDQIVAGLRDTNLPQSDRQQLVMNLQRMLDDLGRNSIRYPIFNLTDPAAAGESSRLIAPFQADLVMSDAATTRRLLDALWQAGIPNVKFLVSKSDDSKPLIEAVEHAEDLGMITGIRNRSAHLVRDDVIRHLAEVGLDYAIVPWCVLAEIHTRVHGSDDWQGIKPAIDAIRSREVTPVVEIPLTAETLFALDNRLSDVGERGVETAELFALAMRDDAVQPDPTSGDLTELHPLAARELRQAAARIEELADQRTMQLIWLPPVECPAGESVLQRAQHGPRAGSDVSLRVEANGDVLPPRGPRAVAGNLLRDPWPTIWNHPVYLAYRQRIEAITRCDPCPGLALCAADCPADPRGWAEQGTIPE